MLVGSQGTAAVRGYVAPGLFGVRRCGLLAWVIAPQVAHLGARMLRPRGR